MRHESPSDLPARIERGHIYRAKRERPGYFHDDRMVLYVSDSRVQYDAPKVRDGRKYPTIDCEKFEKWMGADVTEGYPAGDWAERWTE